jgi:hypothetical protein
MSADEPDCGEQGGKRVSHLFDMEIGFGRSRLAGEIASHRDRARARRSIRDSQNSGDPGGLAQS